MDKKIVELIKSRQQNFKLLENKASEIKSAVEIICCAFRAGNKIFFCGNGGSASDSNHLACEFISKFKKTRKSFPSISLCANNSIMTAISNDFSFDDVFKRQIEGLGQKNDVLIGISTSGKSKNVLNALNFAKNKGLKTIFLTGEEKTHFDFDLEINTPSKATEQIQEMHIALGHIICELCEEEFD